MKRIVFDIETRNVFQDVGSDKPEDLDISVVCLYDYETNTYHSFLQEEFDKMWPILEKADVLISYNGDHFDIPLLNKYCKAAGRGEITKIRSLDILKEIRNCYGRRMKLDQVAEGTLGINKSGNGLDAIVWWRNGEIEKIRKYCLDDVRITKDVYEYALKNKKLLFREGPFTKEIKMDIKHWDPVSEVKTQSLF
ncbi:MAG: ribonuclease H-like domain-containing protein [Candidatus Zambryskibacteria bacterium]|nr:ribonuclease H-like domain-containing protein [Candidatus Zambryskibacteria bacterium]